MTANNQIEEKLKSCEAKLNRLQKDLNTKGEEAARRQKMGIVIRSLLLLFILGYMSFLYSLARGLTADSLTDIGLAKAHQLLPGAFTTITDRLKASAPSVMNRIKQTTLSVPTILREKALVHIDDGIGQLTDEYALKLSEAFDLFVESHKALIQEQYGDKAKIDEIIPVIVEDIAKTFRELTAAITEDVMPEYVSKLDGLNQYLLTLLETPAAGLAPEQRLHKDLISTWISLTQLKDQHPEI